MRATLLLVLAREPLETLLPQLGDLSESKGEDELQGVLKTMMGQLMCKDVLYEPLKELYKVCLYPNIANALILSFRLPLVSTFPRLPHNPCNHNIF
jgi:hypothetical protein